VEGVFIWEIVFCFSQRGLRIKVGSFGILWYRREIILAWEGFIRRWGNIKVDVWGGVANGGQIKIGIICGSEGSESRDELTPRQGRLGQMKGKKSLPRK